jgi:ABC-type proline/glycine betaine transport system permease subunit
VFWVLSGGKAMNISVLADHFLISFAAWIGGLLIGGGIGYFIFRPFENFIESKPDNQKYLAMIPWRTVIFILILLLWSPYLPIWLGLGTPTALVVMVLTISLLACSMTINTLVESRFPAILRVRIFSQARTLLFIAIFATLGVGLVGAGSAGSLFVELIRSMEYGNLVQGSLLLWGICLVLDLLLGFVDYKMRSSTS